MNRRLIFLYGLPGVGKLTIAKELALLTKFPIYHNHLTSDLVYSVFERGEIGSLLKQSIRNLVIDTWAKNENTSLITTLIYKKDDNEDYFQEMSESARKYNIDVYYFHLICSMDVLKQRVQSEDRKLFDKITNWDDQVSKMQRENMLEDVPFENNYRINTTELSAKESAEAIIKILEAN
jgi:broad-specificity NMP kinase